MHTRPKPDWILIANTTRARILQQEPGNAMAVLESFVHPAGRGERTDPTGEARQQECTRFAHELAHFLEQEARQAHFASLTVFAPAAFAMELRTALGNITTRMVSRVHELDLTSVGVAELERRVLQELSLASH